MPSSTLGTDLGTPRCIRISAVLRTTADEVSGEGDRNGHVRSVAVTAAGEPLCCSPSVWHAARYSIRAQVDSAAYNHIARHAGPPYCRDGPFHTRVRSPNPQMPRGSRML